MNTPATRIVRVLIAGMSVGTAVTHAQDGGIPSSEFPDNRQAMASALSTSTLGMAWATSRDMGRHLYRNRAGIRPGSRMTEEIVPASSGAKGGMSSAKGGAKVASISVPRPNRWEVFGSLFFYSESQDGDSFTPRSKKKDDKKDEKDHKYGNYDLARMVGAGMQGGGTTNGAVTRTADTSLDVFGGNIGIEYHINRNWSAGIGLSVAQGDLDLGAVGNSDIDSVALVPYLSYYRADVVGSADLWAGLMYAYGMHSYETRRYTGGGIASGSPDATTHAVEFNIGLNFGEDDFVHGPYAGLRYITGSIDAYTEVGPGATYFGEQDVDSLVSILGYQVSWKIRGGSGFWVPQLRAGWEHEFEDGSVTSFGLPADSRDADLAVVGAGLGYWWDNGWNLGIEYEGRFGSNTEAHYGGLRAGKEF